MFIAPKILTTPIALAALVLIGLNCFGFASCCASQQDQGCHLQFSNSQLKTSAGEVSLDEYYSPKLANLGSIVFLSGAEGLLSSTPSVAGLDNAGENKLACLGFHVFLPHYLDVSGLRSVFGVRTMEEQSERWLTALDEVLSAVTTKEHVRLIVYGRSLGGFLALQLASHRSDVSALILVSAGLRPQDSVRVARLPPTLMINGANDTVVPLSQAKALDQADGWVSSHSLVTISDAGHNLYFISCKITELLENFIDKIPVKVGLPAESPPSA